MRRIATADIGGTHARFAIARIDGTHAVEIGEPIILRTAEFVSFESAWGTFEQAVGGPLPTDLALAVAAPVGNDEVSLTNSHWHIRPEEIVSRLGLGSILLINDFAAVAHALAAVDEDAFLHVVGPNQPLPKAGAITIVGPGTGLGAALLVREGSGEYRVVETEGGHIDFAPLDALEDGIVGELRKKFGRVSVERLVSGPGLLNIYEVLAGMEGQAGDLRGEAELWSAALDGSDRLAVAALDRFCMCLGAVAGDLALAHGASAVVIAGGIGRRLGTRLGNSGFAARFVSKGRFQRRLAATPVKLITYPEPGLLGAAVAFAKRADSLSS
jgi:glucokinase